MKARVRTEFFNYISQLIGIWFVNQFGREKENSLKHQVENFILSL